MKEFDYKEYLAEDWMNKEAGEPLNEYIFFGKPGSPQPERPNAQSDLLDLFTSLLGMNLEAARTAVQACDLKRAGNFLNMIAPVFDPKASEDSEAPESNNEGI